MNMNSILLFCERHKKRNWEENKSLKLKLYREDKRRDGNYHYTTRSRIYILDYI